MHSSMWLLPPFKIAVIPLKKGDRHQRVVCLLFRIHFYFKEATRFGRYSFPQGRRRKWMVFQLFDFYCHHLRLGICDTPKNCQTLAFTLLKTSRKIRISDRTKLSFDRYLQTIPHTFLYQRELNSNMFGHKIRYH